MKDINRYIEHTLLKPTMTGDDVDQLINEAKKYQFAGVCIPPFWVKKASRELAQTNVQVVTVIGFPLGYTTTEAKADECRQAIEDGAQELDIVMNISAFKSKMPWVKIELAKLAMLIHEKECIMKVIIETAYLDEEEIKTACKVCQEAGADYVKTSTGYAPEGAKVSDVQLMRATVSSNVGVKASGGIRNLAQAIDMIGAGADRLGTSSGVKIMEEAKEKE